MSTHQYLTRDTLKSYLLGLASDEQRTDVEQWLATDPEIVAQLNELEIEMERHFLRNAVPPPPAVREAAWERINQTEIQRWKPATYTNARQAPPDVEPPKPNYVNVEVSDTHIRVHKLWRAAFIAVFILSKVFLILGLYYYFKSSSLEQEVIRLKTEVQQAPLSPQVRRP